MCVRIIPEEQGAYEADLTPLFLTLPMRRSPLQPPDLRVHRGVGALLVKRFPLTDPRERMHVLCHFWTSKRRYPQREIFSLGLNYKNP